MDHPLEMANPHLEDPGLYREAVGLVIRHPSRSRRVLFGLRRHRDPGKPHWQLPQGGLDDGENPIDGLFREMEEETGLTRNDVELEALLPVRTSYRWLTRQHQRDNKKGQVHMWVVLRKKTADLPNPKLAKDQEFDEFRWQPINRLAEYTPPFRRPIYQMVAQMMEWWLGKPKTAPLPRPWSARKTAKAARRAAKRKIAKRRR